MMIDLPKSEPNKTCRKIKLKRKQRKQGKTTCYKELTCWERVQQAKTGRFIMLLWT